MENSPFVSVLIPSFNEEAFIGRCLNSVIANDYSRDHLEILVIDGRSTDSTRAIVEGFHDKYPFIKLLDNPDRHKPHALNRGIHAARGDVIIRMDAHATYRSDYISKCVYYLRTFHADNVGGLRKTLPREDTRTARAIAYAISHPFAAGNATYRTGAKQIKWVDTVFGGCYRREVFDRIGLFDEALLRGQDREFNVRLQSVGGRILFAPDIVCEYYVRSDLRSYIPWVYAGGLTPFYVSRMTGRIIFSWRNLVPLAFVLALTATPILSLLHTTFLLVFAGILAAYLTASLIASLPIVKKEQDCRFIVMMPIIFATTHVAYGIGSLVGLLKPIKKQAKWTTV